MRCQQCGRDIADDATFCPHCGERVQGPLAPSAAAPAAREPTAANSDHPSAAVERLRSEPTRFGGQEPKEEELWNGRFSPRAMAGRFILAVLVTIAATLGVAVWWRSAAGWITLAIGLALVWGVLGLAYLNRRMGVHYRLTRFRLIHERGILGRTTDRIETIDIDDVTVHQGPIERLMDVGTVIVASSDRTEPLLRLVGIDHVNSVADLIDNTRRAERQRRGLHLETT
jgi:membrane protein YdbS with pleckstrin-like domain